jgi:histone acetyltransferase (RNA polymerase elongator complex component)
MKHINIALFVVHKGCPHMCSFCNQRSISGSQKDITAADVHSAAQTAIATLTESQAAGGEIAFFGGSFTMVEREYMLSLLEAAYEYVEKGIFKGIRISTRPDCINEEVLTVLKEYGVSSIELGCQSMNDEVLLLNGRGHTAEDVRRAAKLIKEYGFEFGVQMMTGLYGDSDELAVKTAESLIALSPDTARIYPTVVFKNTELCNMCEQGSYIPLTLEDAVERSASV